MFCYPVRGGGHKNAYTIQLSASGSVMVCKLDKQTCKSEFETHWVPYSFDLVPHLMKKLRILIRVPRVV